MKDWIARLDDFIRFNEKELLTHASKISHQQAVDKAHTEYDKYRVLTSDKPSPVERHFVEVVEAVKGLQAGQEKRDK
jgi:hypothetical protein